MINEGLTSEELMAESATALPTKRWSRFST